MIEVRCDICQRQASMVFATVTVVPDEGSGFLVEPLELHICAPRDGGDTGCYGRFQEGLQHATKLAREWRAEAGR